MQLDRLRPFCVMAVLIWMTGCAGNGQGLDQNGQPIAAGSNSGSGEVTADLASIEANVFTPICSKCHIGSSAPEGLQLDAAHAYDFLVGVPSVEEPSLLRVNPGNPDTSYMLMKIEGAPGIEGGQMPLGETPLPAATIAAIRQWIANGAPNVAAAAAAAAFEVKSTFPADQSRLATPPAQLLMSFSSELDASLVNDTTVSLEQLAAPDSVRPDRPIPVARTLVSANPCVLLLAPRLVLQPGDYRLRLRGSGGGGLADIAARGLNTDRVVLFTVQAAQ